MAKKSRATKRTRTVLTEQCAWDMAMAASRPLQGRVRLVSTTRDIAVLGSYEWIEVCVPLPESMPSPPLQNTLNWVMMARNACLVWHMLACCCGFQGHENSVFWKKLVEHVGCEKAVEGEELWQPDEPVNDACKFFPSWAKKTAFPRFRLHFPFSKYFDPWGYEIDDDDLDIDSADSWVKNVVRTFTGLSNSYDNSDVKSCATKLMPFIDFNQWCRTPVEIGVHLGESYDLEDLADTLRDLIARVEADAAARKEERFAWRLVGQSRFPMIKLTKLSLCDRQSIADDESLEELTDIINTCNIFIPEVHITPNADYMGEDALANFMYAVSRDRREGSARVNTLGFHLSEAEEWQVELLFSAVPVAGVQTLVVQCNRTRLGEGSMSRHAWTWLAYAIFHPWASHSALDLDLTHVDVSEDAAKSIRSALTAQRHLYRLVHGENDDTLPDEDDYEDTLGRYSIVWVRKGTRCFLNASLKGEQVCTLDCEMMLTAVAKFDIFSVESLPRSVCVIIPGRGITWVTRSRVTGIGRPFADFSEIMGLRLGHMSNPALTISDLHGLLYKVSKLDIAEWGELTAEKLHDVLKECFLLDSLRVHHRGDLFHKWTPEDDDALYEEQALGSLQIVYDDDEGHFLVPSQAAWQGVLHSLTEFSIATYGSWLQSLPAVQKAFRDGWSVQHFVWKSVDWFHNSHSYATKQLNSRKLLGISPGRFDKAQHPFSAAARRAFASVIKDKAQLSDAQNARGLRSRKETVVGRLGQDVARLICDFATTDSDRTVWISHGI